MTTTPAPAQAAATTDDSARPALRPLYLARFVFALVWAGLFVAAATPFGKLALVHAVLYPAFDVLAAVVDLRSSAGGRSRVALVANAAVSTAAAVALVAVGTGDIGDVLRVWGVWAVVAGAVQLGVALQRRAHQGQVPMMLSGGISVLAGTSFVASASGATSLTSIAGYAVLGGVFFLVSALRLGLRG